MQLRNPARPDPLPLAGGEGASYRALVLILLVLAFTACQPAAPLGTPTPRAGDAIAGQPTPTTAPAPTETPAPTVDPSLASLWQGRTITILVGASPGANLDTWARLVSRHYGRFLPGGPLLGVENVAGASGISMGDRLALSRPDGLTIGIADQTVTAFQLQASPSVAYDATTWTWLGSLTIEQYVFAAHRRLGVSPANLDALRTKEIKTALVAPGDFSHQAAVALKLGLGWRITPSFGYQGERESVLSVDRGETDAVTLSWAPLLFSQPDDLASRILVPLVQFGSPRKEPLADGVPTAIELFNNAPPQANQVLAYVGTPLIWSRSLAAPPGLDPSVGLTMRAAFDQMTEDADFLNDAARIKLEILPTAGERVQALVSDYIRTSPEVIRLVDEHIRVQSPS